MIRAHAVRRSLLALTCVASIVALSHPALAHGVVTTDGGGSVRLTSHEVDVTVAGRVAQFDVKQTFLATGSRPFEGTYLFPLPDGALVEKFELTLGGETHTGEILDPKAARGVYEGIVRQKRDPGLLEHAGLGLVRARMFPLEPGKPAAVRVQFRTVLPEDAGTVELRYPLATARLAGGAVDRVRVTVAVETERPLQVVHSPTHEVKTERDGDRKARVVFERSGAVEDKDFVLWLSSGTSRVGCTVASSKQDGEDGTFLAVLSPGAAPTAETAMRRDVVFVLDVSGSMQGEKLKQAKAALAYGLRSLSTEDRFGVVTFSTGVRSFREGLASGGLMPVTEAIDWIGAQPAEGGTNIEGGLREGLSMLGAAQGDGAETRLPFVVFITDGEPTVGEQDTERLLRVAAETNRAHARIFTFGVGYDVRVALLDRLAETTRGRRDYVAPEESLEVVMSRFFRKVSRPVLVDGRLEMGADVHDVFPPTVSELFAGESVVVLGRYQKPGDRTIVLKGRDGSAASGATANEWNVSLRADGGDGSLVRVWAQRKVGYLLDQIRLNGRSQELVDSVATLARRHGLVTPFTSALVVEDADLARLRRLSAAGGQPTVKDAELSDHNETDNDLPTEEALGEGGISDRPFAGPSNNGLIGIGGGAGGAFQRRGGHRNLRAGGGGKKADDTLEDALRWLAAHQEPDGSWDPVGFARRCDGALRSSATIDGAGDVSRRTGVTALSLLPFLASGYTNRSEGPFGKVVANGLRWLRNVQDAEGFFGTRGGAGGAEDHSIATLAIIEAFGVTGSTNYKNPAQRGLDALSLPVAVVDPALDAIAASWAALARNAAEGIVRADAVAGRSPSLAIDAAWRAALQQTLDARPSGAAISAADADAPFVALAMRVLFGADDARFAAATKSLVDAEAAAAARGPLDLRRAQLVALLAVAAAKAELRSSWDRVAKQRVVDAQRKDTDFCEARGSFDPPASATTWGRVGSTAFAALAALPYYRWPEVRRGAFAAAVPPANSTASNGAGSAGTSSGGAAAAPTPGGDVRDSLGVRRLKESTTAPEAAGRLHSVDGKTFRQERDGRFIDLAWDGKAAPERIESGSDAWIALAASSPTVARCLALGDHVLAVVGARVVEVVPAPAK